MAERPPFPSASPSDVALEQLVGAVQASANYQAISEAFIRRVGAAELTRRRNLKEAIKATKNKLHQVCGAYLDKGANYPAWLEILRTAQAQGDAALRQACAQVMRYHASTRERLPHLEQFYARIFADLPPIRSLLDVACGLNPLAIPWMNLPAEVEYVAVDVYGDMVAFLAAFMALLPQVRSDARLADALSETIPRRFDVALALKAIPCLEQVDKLAGRHLLDALPADVLIVSFPAHSLGGRGKGMPEHYGRHFRQLVADKPWRIEQFDFASEVVFRMIKY